MTSSRHAEVTEATTELYVPKNKPEGYVNNIDRKATATLALPDGTIGKLDIDLSAPARYGIIPTVDYSFKAEGELGSVEINNYVMPVFYHTITVRIRGGPTSTEKVYKDKSSEGVEWRTTHMYQLAAFVDKIRGRKPKAWVSKEESVATMECIEKIYEKARNSSYQLLIMRSSTVYFLEWSGVAAKKFLHTTLTMAGTRRLPSASSEYQWLLVKTQYATIKK